MEDNKYEIEVHFKNAEIGLSTIILPATLLHRVVMEQFCEPCINKDYSKKCDSCLYSQFIDLAYKIFTSDESEDKNL